MNVNPTFINRIVLLLGFIVIFTSKSIATQPAIAVTPKYEYIVVELNTWTYEKDDERRRETGAKYPEGFRTYGSNPNISNATVENPILPSLDQATTLNELGKYGWELVAISHNNETGADKIFGYFKRKVEKETRY